MKAIRLITAVLSAAAVLIGLPASGYAATLILLQDPNFIYNQNDGRPCVIGDPSCQSSGWDTYVIQPGDVTGTPPEYAVSSPLYTVGQIRDLGKGEFINIGIDVNSDGTPPVEALLLFDVLINGVSAFSYTGTVSLQQLNPGTGSSDALLQGLNLTGYSNTDTIRFFAHVLYASDGREQFFLVGGSEIPDKCVVTPDHPDCTPPPPPTCEQTNTCPPPPDPNVPEPASLLLVGTALVAGVLRRRHRQAKRK